MAGENGREGATGAAEKRGGGSERGWPNFSEGGLGGCGGGSRSFALGKILESFPPLSPAAARSEEKEEGALTQQARYSHSQDKKKMVGRGMLGFIQKI